MGQVIETDFGGSEATPKKGGPKPGEYGPECVIDVDEPILRIVAEAIRRFEINRQKQAYINPRPRGVKRELSDLTPEEKRRIAACCHWRGYVPKSTQTYWQEIASDVLANRHLK